MRRGKALLEGFAVVLCALLHCSGVAWGDVSISLAGVPQELSYPLPGGRNVVLTATVREAEVRAVWLACSRDAQARFMFADAGGGTYQVNLADPVLAAMLRATRGAEQFQAFAETQDGHVVQSIPVRYSVARPALMPPRIYIYAQGKRKELFGEMDAYVPRDWELFASEAGYRHSLLGYVLPPGFWTEPTGTYTFSPEEAERIEVRFEEDADRPSAHVQAGEKRWSFGPTETANVVHVPMTGDIRSALNEQGSLTLMCGQSGQEQVRIVLNAPPRRLDLPESGAEMTIIQRRSKEVPGSDGYLKVYIDDITGGQVLVTLTTAQGGTLVDQTSMRTGDEVTFTVGEQRYRLKVERLANLLVGDDYGVFTISPAVPPQQAEQAERDKIERLIQIIEDADVTFIRNGKQYSAKEAAEHIREKYDFAGTEIESLEQFIENVASVSWTTRRDYLVRLGDGTEVKARDWLREQSEDLSGDDQTGQE